MIELEIQQKAKALRSNVYKLVVKYEHGDADLNTTESALFTTAEVDILKRLIEALYLLSAVSGNQRDSGKADIHEFVNALVGAGYSSNEAHDLVDSWVPGDSIYSHGFAFIETPTVTFFDDTGHEHAVKIKRGT